MSTTPSKSNVIVRIYEVTLVDGADNTYDPFTISLSWPEVEAMGLQREAPEILDEAFRRAVKIERRNNPASADVEFTNGGVTMSRERLVAAKAR